MKTFSIYTISERSTILEALQTIDRNKSGFVVVLNDDGVVCGTLTDGDIRRAFIRGKNVSDPIEPIYIRAFRFLTEGQSLGDAIETFRSSSIKFLPVLNRDKKLVNLITKKQLHAQLLFDIHADLSYDFSTLNENAMDYEIFERPWGFYKTTVKNDYFQSKVINIKPGESISLQSHERREEYWVIAHGKGIVQLDNSRIDVRCGSTLFIPKGCRHRIENTDKRESLIITEVQIGDYFGEDDIRRYEDRYDRI